MEQQMLGIVYVMDGDDPIGSTWVTNAQPRTWEVLKKHFTFIKGDKKRYDTILVPSANAAWRKGVYTPQMCLYDATNKYMTRLLGCSMDLEDEHWFKEHPLTLASGVEIWETLRVAQELIAPYGLKISRVRMKPGLNLQGDLVQWQRVLGVNPLALKNRTTTNDEFIQLTGMEPEAMYFGFEFNAAPLIPSISCGMKGDNKNSQEPWGHAEYLSPRGSHESSLLSFQIDRAKHVSWLCEPVYAPAPPNDKSTQYLDLHGFTLPNGKTVSDEAWGPLRSSMGLDNVGKSGYGSSFSGLSNGTQLADGFRECHLCGDCRMSDDEMLTLSSRVCRECWAVFWVGHKCKSCETPLKDSTPMYGGYTTRENEPVVVGICTKCHKATDLAASEDHFQMASLVYASLIEEEQKGGEGKDEPTKQKENSKGNKRSKGEQVRSVH